MTNKTILKWAGSKAPGSLRCYFGFHKWTVYKKVYKTNMYGHKYITQHFGCLRCGKMKAETQECQ